MADFIYQEPFPVGEDKTKYRLLTKEYVKVVECDGRKILKVDPKGLELLSKEAYADVSFYLRAAHLQKLRNILEDPEATDNDKFVAYTMLLNQTVSAEGELPTCQDTGTAICIGHKGEDVWTGADDAECIARGVYETYKDRNLRYSQVVPFTMTDEKNSGTNLPAQIDIYGGKPGMEYEFLFITKGGGSANKTFLYQQTKALLNEKTLTEFIRTHIKDLGTSACPPYHLAICIGGTSAEMCLSTVKKASAGYLDALPTSGNEGGRCFRDLEWEEKVLKICQESGVGAQFGGKYLVHDVRVIRAPRHAASCPVAIGVSCSADRNIKAKITPEGIFLEQLEKNPARFLPKQAPAMSPAVDIDLDEGMDKVREKVAAMGLEELVIPFSAKFERKLMNMTPEEAAEYCAKYHTKSQMPKIITTGYHVLNLIHFFTAGPDEVKCWTIRRGTLAPQAAGVIHTDFEKGFICAEVYKFEDFKELGNEAAIKAAGKLKQQGRNYEVEDGDVIFFKFNVGTEGKKK